MVAISSSTSAVSAPSPPPACCFSFLALFAASRAFESDSSCFCWDCRILLVAAPPAPSPSSRCARAASAASSFAVISRTRFSSVSTSSW